MTTERPHLWVREDGDEGDLRCFGCGEVYGDETADTACKNPITEAHRERRCHVQSVVDEVETLADMSVLSDDTPEQARHLTEAREALHRYLYADQPDND